MSGHNGFAPIGANNNTGNIGNVNTLPPVNSNPQPPNANNNVGGTEANVPNPVAEKTVRLNQQLDVLLVQAAKIATKGVDAKALKAKVGSFGIGGNELKDLNKLIDNAAATMDALNKFTGRQLVGAALELESSLEVKNATGEKIDAAAWDESGEAGGAIKAAIDAQAALSEKFFELINSGGLTKAAKRELEDAAMLCDRRACEIETLMIQFTTAMIKSQGDLKELDPKIKEGLDAKLFDLMGEKSISMHGNAEALERMKQRLEPLAKRLDDFAKAPESSLSSQTFASMRMELNTAKLAFEELANGYEVEHDTGPNAVNQGNEEPVKGEKFTSKVYADSQFMTAAKGIIAQVEERMENARKSLAEASLKAYIDSVFAPPAGVDIFAQKFRPLLNNVEPRFDGLFERKSKVHVAALKLAKKPTDKDAIEELKNAVNEYNSSRGETIASLAIRSLGSMIGMLVKNDAQGLKNMISREISSLPADVQKTITPKLIDDFAHALDMFVKGQSMGSNSPQVAEAFSFFSGSADYATQIAHIKARGTIDRMGDEDFVSSTMFIAAFKGDLTPTTLIEARTHGFADEDINPEFDDRNVEKSEPLGSGAVNSVSSVTFKNGETYVFKAETPGRATLTGAPYFRENGITSEQQLSNLNLATQKTADVLGFGDIMTKTSVGSHKGQYGIFMEKAPGVVIGKFAYYNKRSKDSLSRNEVQKLDKEAHTKVQGEFMRKCNRLDWFDIITGQADRHNQNVMVDVGKDLTVTVKGIDNDTCYSADRIGMSKYKLSGGLAKKFENLMWKVALMYGNENSHCALDVLMKDKGITKNADGSYTVDCRQFESPELNYCLMYTLGIYSTYVPDVIDKDVYDKLMTLKEGPARDKYLADLKARLSDDSYNAAVSRLDDAIRHAEELKLNGKVYTEADWADHEKQKAVFNNPKDQMPEMKKKFGVYPRKEVKLYDDIMESIKHLTQGNYKRNGFAKSAKYGWFSEI